jgi:hypothetical protein
MPKPLAEIELFAWLGEDELSPLGLGEIGLKQGLVPAGIIPLVAIDRALIERVWPQLERQAVDNGKRIRLCRFRFAEVIRETKAGE